MILVHLAYCSGQTVYQLGDQKSHRAERRSTLCQSFVYLNNTTLLQWIFPVKEKPLNRDTNFVYTYAKGFPERYYIKKT